jgi:hypothetical protein
MSDYSQVTSFGPKDALITGDPNKRIKGTEFDSEFEAIEVAVATKFDSSDLADNAATIAGASSTSIVTPAGGAAAYPRLAQDNTFTANQTLDATSPTLFRRESDAAANNRYWSLQVQGEQFNLFACPDSLSGCGAVLTVDRTGATVDALNLRATSVQVNGQDVRNTAILNAGTLADARVAQSNVTQHAAAVLATSNITSGTYAPTVTGITNFASSSSAAARWSRVGDTVTVSGYVQVTPTLSGSTVFRITLPVASALSILSDVSGTFVARVSTSYNPGAVSAHVGAAGAQLDWNSPSGSAQDIHFVFAYRVI